MGAKEVRNFRTGQQLVKFGRKEISQHNVDNMSEYNTTLTNCQNFGLFKSPDSGKGRRPVQAGQKNAGPVCRPNISKSGRKSGLARMNE
jgi:hypothetical protein